MQFCALNIPLIILYFGLVQYLFCNVCWSESKKVNDVADRDEEEQKRVDELEKMLSNYENELRTLFDGREKVTLVATLERMNP